MNPQYHIKAYVNYQPRGGGGNGNVFSCITYAFCTGFIRFFLRFVTEYLYSISSVFSLPNNIDQLHVFLGITNFELLIGLIDVYNISDQFHFYIAQRTGKKKKKKKERKNHGPDIFCCFRMMPHLGPFAWHTVFSPENLKCKKERNPKYPYVPPPPTKFCSHGTSNATLRIFSPRSKVRAGKKYSPEALTRFLWNVKWRFPKAVHSGTSGPWALALCLTTMTTAVGTLPCVDVWQVKALHNCIILIRDNCTKWSQMILESKRFPI